MDKINIINLSKQAGEIIKESGYESIIASHKLLHDRIENPQSYTGIVGETSSGKSTIINGLFLKKILPSSAKPTTGAVTQLIIDNQLNKQEFIAVNRDASIEIIDQKVFNHLVEKPDKNLLRLKITLPHPSQEYDGLNIFDTPGYNSLVTEHEEVLRDFIPECDVIIHVVGYRVGFGDQDQLLLSSIYEHIQNLDLDIPVILVVNRCPSEITLSSKRIVEIHNHAKDTLHKDLKIILVPSVIQDDLENPKDVLPEANELWSSLSEIVNSNHRKELLDEISRVKLLSLLNELSLNLEEKVALSKLSKDELEFLKCELSEFINTKEKLFSILDIYTKRWERVVPNLLDKSISGLIRSTTEIIEKDNKWLDANTCIAYLETHQLPFNVREITKEVNDYFKIQMEEMNKEMNDISNQALIKLSQSINYKPSKTYSEIIKVLGSKIGMRLLGNTSKSLLNGLGGVGGVASGTGNLVKMGVSRFGKLFGKTFSREVYNTIGRNFTKKIIGRLSVAFTVIVEAGIYIYESKTWQENLIKKIETTLNEFKEEVTGEITLKTIKSIKDSNIETINDVFLNQKIDSNNEIFILENDEGVKQLEGIRNKITEINKLKKELAL